ncbi:hypothetical protein KCU81_g1651, partial [Aureobasidium melanogenum]|uniref:Uncharacterized protein n=1 Tax=Aureobasidium melanogenum (strain CBS 110374) TaxID=1043003 RepID=A0A074VU45_AURM1
MTSTTDIGLTNAVRINCTISQEIHGRPIFESVTLSDEDVQKLMRPAKLRDQSSPIARRIGIPLRAYIEHQHERPSYVRVDWSYSVFLHMGCELNTEQDSENWGWAPDYWKMTAGDAYVLKFQIAMEERYTVPVDKRKDVLALITKKNFDAYREKFEKEGKTADYDFDSTEKMYEELLRTGKLQT